MVAAVCSASLRLPANLLTPAVAATFPADPLVAGMLEQVRPEALTALDGALSGEWPAWVEAAPYRITTRATASGLPLQKATQYAYEHLRALGLSPGFYDWSMNGYSGRDVVGTLPGSTTPGEIVLLTAHLDDAPWSGNLAPGADDNASGSAGLLLAAEILSGYRFARTVRFALFTGEEQGLLGSRQYAAAAHLAGDNIVAVLNLDMIAWDSLDGPTLRLHTRNGSAADQVIADTFTNVVSAYNLNLAPQIVADGNSTSDHASFWAQGYPAVLAIEDDHADFNRYYHSSGDRLFHLNLAYFNDFVKAAVGSVGLLALPVGAILGDFRAQVEPPAAVQWGEPADVITYSLELSNRGSLADTYDLSVADNAWATDFAAVAGPVAAGSSVEVTVTVTIPAAALGGEADIAALTVVSEGSKAPVDTAELTTVVLWKLLYLPLVLR